MNGADVVVCPGDADNVLRDQLDVEAIMKQDKH